MKKILLILLLSVSLASCKKDPVGQMTMVEWTMGSTQQFKEYRIETKGDETIYVKSLTFKPGTKYPYNYSGTVQARTGQTVDLYFTGPANMPDVFIQAQKKELGGVWFPGRVPPEMNFKILIE